MLLSQPCVSCSCLWSCAIFLVWGYKPLQCAAGYAQAHEGLSPKRVGLLSLADISQSTRVCYCWKIKPCMQDHQQASHMTVQKWKASCLTYIPECAHPDRHLTKSKSQHPLAIGSFHISALHLLHMIWYCGPVSERCLTSILALTGY